MAVRQAGRRKLKGPANYARNFTDLCYAALLKIFIYYNHNVYASVPSNFALLWLIASSQSTDFKSLLV